MSLLSKTVHARAAAGKGVIARPAAAKTGVVITHTQPAQGKSIAAPATAKRS